MHPSRHSLYNSNAGGGLHAYDITGDLECLPLKVGFFAIRDLSLTTGSSLTCASHVLRMFPEHGLMTIAWYARGVRVIAISRARPAPRR